MNIPWKILSYVPKKNPQILNSKQVGVHCTDMFKSLASYKINIFILNNWTNEKSLLMVYGSSNFVLEWMASNSLFYIVNTFPELSIYYHRTKT